MTYVKKGGNGGKRKGAGGVRMPRVFVEADTKEKLRQLLQEGAEPAIRYLIFVLHSDDTVTLYTKSGMAYHVDKYSPESKISAAKYILNKLIADAQAEKSKGDEEIIEDIDELKKEIRDLVRENGFHDDKK